MRRPLSRSKRRVVIALGCIGLLAAALLVDYYAFPYGASPPRHSADKGTNGLWVRYTYYFGEKSDAEAVWLCTVCGFEGVQWDYEICEDRDKDLLALLSETRAALPQGKILSVAAPMWFPAVRAFGWSEDYFSQVAARSDQVCVMCYDTGMLLPRAYVALTAQNVAHVTHAVAQGNPQCGVLLGIPTYGKGLFSHNSHKRISRPMRLRTPSPSPVCRIGVTSCQSGEPASA